MKISGWGRYPVIDSRVISPLTTSDIHSSLSSETAFSGISRGMGRSYGDSALADHVISTRNLNHILEFDSTTGKVRCSAGMTLSELLDFFLPKGWFLSVTPGTRFVTVGGAVASDVHGKNHHKDGSFCDHVESFRLMLANGQITDCSKNEHQELFHATCGGMGLTGVIVDVTLYLKRVTSAYIEETTLKTSDLTETLELFDEYDSSTYSVAWLDCLASGEKLGRSLLMLGEHAEHGTLTGTCKQSIPIPVDFPGFVLNQYSISLFNHLYYNRKKDKHSTQVVHYDPFFFPLDRLLNWNRIYGVKGFVQYQFVIPKEAGKKGMALLLKKITDSRRGSFLAVLKSFGKNNDNYLSFPMEGYTLALDFKLEMGLFKLLNELDQIVLDYGGRIYLAKDARMTESTFKKSYKNWETFMSIRKKYHADRTFNSHQSYRLGL